MHLQLVVAEEFSQFVQKPGVQSYRSLLEQLRGNQIESLRGKTLVAGQGLSEMQIDHAFCLGIALGLSQEFSCWNEWSRNSRAGYALSHKHRNENVLISTPRRIDASNFDADLLIDANSELMLDHLTGLHVQGMVLTEACRQMFIAVTEAHCMGADAPAKRYFVINEMNMRFLQFAFPLPATIQYKMLDFQQPRPDRTSVVADMEVMQNGRAVAGMAVKFSVFDAAYLGPREHQLAEQALAHSVDLATADFAARGLVQPKNAAAPIVQAA
ncbi:AfsA-related hotdog domain-containing protein [Massilia sp. BJB1822]|uniref:AfsA-related hotdog domain-containing protein n=1 Tax=Massilia sp. BJB1822 TaxID=2744470 RepID=UPI001593E6E5|nr:AfsA-related hotdog domain-containing protein [Massilia sp. BJB1822]NVD99198.1 hypothetical protein [Massilia sp. BJB1822]